MQQIALALAGGCFLFVFARTMYALGAGRHRRSPANFAVMCAGFCLQTAYLYMRGRTDGRCPTGTFSDMLVFLAWSMVFLYLVIGTTYRLSLLGAFTAPFVLVFQIVASVLHGPERPALPRSPGPFVEFHGAVSMVAYGAFALSCVAGVMFLLHERQLKRRTLHPLFDRLPPISDLVVAIRRLIVTGLALLTAGIASGFLAGSPPAKLAVTAVVWAIYACILLAVQRRRLSARRVAGLAVIAFVLALMALLGIGVFGHQTL